MFYIFNFGIKIYQIVPKSLTIQKHDYVDKLSVASFAASIKPSVFDGPKYKRWREKVTLWLTAMNIMYVVQGKPEQVSQEEFEAADNLFLGTIISVLPENHVGTHLSLTSGKEL